MSFWKTIKNWPQCQRCYSKSYSSIVRLQHLIQKVLHLVCEFTEDDIKTHQIARRQTWGTFVDCCAWAGEKGVNSNALSAKLTVICEFHSRAPFARTDYRITLSALAKTAGGIVNPISLAVFRLITNSKSFGATTGRSAGVAPLRILST
jgi:hypothetical protein